MSGSCEMVGDGVAKAAGVSTDLVDGSGCFPAVKRLCKFGKKPTVLVAREGFRVGEHGGKQVDGDLAVSEEGDVFQSRDIVEGNVDRGELSSQNRSVVLILIIAADTDCDSTGLAIVCHAPLNCVLPGSCRLWPTAIADMWLEGGPCPY
jgi:hypothetical protein